ncbi:hypothetical protein [Fundidesulfovibrio agrisoli]|uniref:hypothetical protein n=1 Tax=Fundidesulfovibrio agrisoli TaxID=2922717 RepID=UPI001FAB6E0D|nr:hypothetical protein [Fundidesulfovibrio agrisoli]
MSELTLFAALTALVCLPLCFALAAAALPLTSAALLFNPPKRVKVFRDKYGQQTSTSCLLCGLVAVLGLVGGALALQSLAPASAAFWLGWPLPLLPLCAGLAVSAALAVVYRAVWQNLKDNRPLHSAIGVAATLAAWALGYLFVSFFRHYVLSPLQPSEDPFLFIPPLDSVAWLLLPAALGMSLALAGSVGTLYLIHRRDKDDFGRDYYNYGLKMGSRWSIAGAALAVASAAVAAVRLWPSVRDLPVRPVFFWGEAVFLCALAMAAILWGLVLRNQNALRLKVHLVAAFALSWLALSAQALVNLRFFLG